MARIFPQDFEDDGSGISDAVLGSLTCEQLTLLECYSGSGENFGVKAPCPANFPNDPDKTRVKGGCYYFVQDELFKTIKDDLKYLAEWKARFRFVFGACRGVISHVFQNNWVNGTLYTFAFRKQTILHQVTRQLSPMQRIFGWGSRLHCTLYSTRI